MVFTILVDPALQAAVCPGLKNYLWPLFLLFRVFHKLIILSQMSVAHFNIPYDLETVIFPAGWDRVVT